MLYSPPRFIGGSGGKGCGINDLKGSGEREFVLYIPETLLATIFVLSGDPFPLGIGRKETACRLCSILPYALVWEYP
jgi:hypothetical protein